MVGDTECLMQQPSAKITTFPVINSYRREC